MASTSRILTQRYMSRLLNNQAERANGPAPSLSWICRVCGKPVKVGDEVISTKRNKRVQLRHYACYERSLY